MISVAERKDLIAAAQGHQPLDLLIRQVRLVNVYTGRIEPAALGIRHGRIVSLDADGFEARQVFDADGQYALPGFIDTHIHVDSTLLIPENLAQLIVPRADGALRRSDGDRQRRWAGGHGSVAGEHGPPALSHPDRGIVARADCAGPGDGRR